MKRKLDRLERGVVGIIVALELVSLTALSACSTTSTATPIPFDQAAIDARVDAALRLAWLDDGAEEGIASIADELSSWEAGLDGASPGMADAMSLLRATMTRDRRDRLARLRGVAADASDRVIARQAAHALERDEAWLAENLGRDALYSRFADVINGVVQSAASALQGNPVGVAKPILAGIETAVRGGVSEPIDRKRWALTRAWLRRGGDPSDLPDQLAELEAKSVAYSEELCERELHIAERLIALSRGEGALAHLHAAAVHRPNDASVLALERRVDRTFDQRRRRLEASIAVASRAWPAGFEREPEKTVDGSELPTPIGVTNAASLHRIDVARALHRSDVAAYIFTGERRDPDPLRRYDEARREMTRSLVDWVELILWVPATLVRSVHAGLGHPLDDGEIVDALAAHLFFVEDPVDRDEYAVELIDRYERRGELRKALAVAEVTSLDAFEVERLRGRVADLDVEEASRRDVQSGAVSIEAVRSVLAGRDLFRALDREGAKIDPPRVWLEGAALAFDVRGQRGSERRTLELTPAEQIRVEAMMWEWRWRRRLLTVPSYLEATDGVPLELRAGVGAHGLSFLPRLLPERYQGSDRRQFE